jgi:hypothetical protein
VIVWSYNIAYNVLQLCEGGGFYHLGSAEINAESASWRMINLRRGGLRSTVPMLRNATFAKPVLATASFIHPAIHDSMFDVRVGKNEINYNGN